MRQQMCSTRAVAATERSRTRILGIAARISASYRGDLDDEPTRQVTPRPRGLQCFRLSTATPLPLGVRPSALVDPGAVRQAFEVGVCDCPTELDLPTGPLSRGQADTPHAQTLWQEPSVLLAGTSGTARVLEALAGGWPQPAVCPVVHRDEPATTAEAEVQGELFELSARLDADPCDTRVLGPRLELSLEAGLGGTGSRLWDAIATTPEPAGSGVGSDGAVETGRPEDLNAWLGIAEPSLSEELALACEIGARIDDTPTDLVARDVALARAVGLADMSPSPYEASVQQPTQSDTQDIERARDIERASERAVTTKPRAATDRVAVRELATTSKLRMAGTRSDHRGTSATQAWPRFRWPKLRWPWGHGRLEGEALRRRRQEVFRKVLARLATGLEGSTTVSEHGSETMSGTNKLEWKPGDPFAGERRRRFRWHAMFLAAGGVAGTGYAALWLLKTAGMLSA